MPVDRWSEEETRRLAGLVERLGQRWCLVAEHLAPRTSKQCRRRWKNVVALPERKVRITLARRAAVLSRRLGACVRELRLAVHNQAVSRR